MNKLLKPIKLIIFILIILSFSHCKEDKKTTKKEVIFLTYGELPPVNYIDEKDSIITQKFGFQIKRLGNCEVTNSMISKAKRTNSKSNAQMKSKYGNDWITKFEKETGIIFYVPFVER